jgi:MFS family permease
MAQDAPVPESLSPPAVTVVSPTASATGPGTPPGPTLPGARMALALLLLINLFNYIDRQILAAVEPEVRSELLRDLPEDVAMGRMAWLPFAFLFSYMLLAPVFGILADRFSRWLLVGFGVILWTIASGASGLPWTMWGLSAGMAFTFLLLTRCFVGVGEAAYGPVAPAMIADLFPVSKRGMVLSWFYLAIPVGGALGYAIGERVKDLISWHWAFICVVPPGLLLGVWCFFMRDPPRGQADAVEGSTRSLRLADIVRLLRIPSYALNTIGMTLMTFAIGGIAYWMAAFLEQHQVEGLGPLGPRTLFGAITALAGLIATLAGGIAGDWLRPRFSGSYFIVSGIALIVGFPMILGVVYTPFPWAWIFVFLGVFCLFFNTGPTNTILANVTHPSVRASGFALNILIIHLFGDAISPFVMSWVSGGVTNIDRGFILVAAVMAVGGVVWLFGAHYLESDTRLAPTRL